MQTEVAIYNRQNLVELTKTKRETFLQVVEKTNSLEGLSSRHKEILNTRYRYLPISCYDEEYFKSIDFRKKVIQWCILSTINDTPDDALFTMLTYILTTEFGGLTMEEIDLALKLNIVGEYSEVVNSYNSMSIKFICSVLNHYKKYRLEADKAYQDLRSTLMLPEKVEFSKFQEDYITGAGIIANSMKLHAGQEVIGSFITGFEYMSRLGIMEYDEFDYLEQIDKTVQMMYDNSAHLKKMSKNKFDMKTLFNDEQAVKNAAISIVKEEMCKQFLFNTNTTDLIEYIEKGLQQTYGLGEEQLKQELAAIPPRIVITPYNQ